MKQYCEIKMITLVGIIVVTLTSSLTTVTVAVSEEAALRKKCRDDFNKVGPCLSYATGKAEVPIKECCGAVQEIKTKNPVCLCFFMEKTLNGSSDTIKGMGIHVDRLLHLPSACKLTNTSLSYCPKLLNLPANSPEYKIFTNVSSLSSTSPGTTASGASLPLTNTKSNGPMFRPQISSPSLIAVAIFFCVSLA